MTTMSTEAGPSRPELELLLAAALRAAEAAVPPAEAAHRRVTNALIGWLLVLAVAVGAYDLALVAGVLG